MTWADLRAELAGWSAADWLQHGLAAVSIALCLFLAPWAGYVLALLLDLPLD